MDEPGDDAAEDEADENLVEFDEEGVFRVKTLLVNFSNGLVAVNIFLSSAGVGCALVLTLLLTIPGRLNAENCGGFVENVRFIMVL